MKSFDDFLKGVSTGVIAPSVTPLNEAAVKIPEKVTDENSYLDYLNALNVLISRMDVPAYITKNEDADTNAKYKAFKNAWKAFNV